MLLKGDGPMKIVGGPSIEAFFGSLREVGIAWENRRKIVLAVNSEGLRGDVHVVVEGMVADDCFRDRWVIAGYIFKTVTLGKGPQPNQVHIYKFGTRFSAVYDLQSQKPKGEFRLTKFLL